MDSYLIDPKRKLHVCGNNPTCDGYEIEEGEFRIKGYDGPIVECEKCGSEMHLKMGRFGKYMACTNDECKTRAKFCATVKWLRRRKIRFRCQSCRVKNPTRTSCCVMVLRVSSRRPTPSRNRVKHVRRWLKNCTASVTVCQKNCVTADAPQQDPEGNKTVVRFSRKTKQQYVAAEKEGKATGWSAFFVDGKWVEGKK